MKNKLIFILIIVIFIVIIIASLSIGRYPLTIKKILYVTLTALHSQTAYQSPYVKVSGNDKTVLFIIRIPRIIAVILVGGGLAISGIALQSLFKNPLVSPYVLGVSSGAGFGAAMGILLSLSPIAIQSSALIFGLIAVFLAMLIGHSGGTNSSLSLVLAGIIVGALFTALISLVKYLADPFEKLPAIVFWLMGSFASVTYNQILISLPFTLIGIVVLILLRWKINIFAMGEEEALSMGENPKLLRFLIIVSTSLITASAVALSGIIGWIGLVIPHIVRIIFGPDTKKTVPMSLIFGAGYLLIIDDISRAAFAIEIPIGILTAVIGAPIFAYLLRRHQTGWLQ